MRREGERFRRRIWKGKFLCNSVLSTRGAERPRKSASRKFIFKERLPPAPADPPPLRLQDWPPWYESCPGAGPGGNPTCARDASSEQLYAFGGETERASKHSQRGTEPGVLGERGGRLPSGRDAAFASALGGGQPAPVQRYASGCTV